MDVKSSIGSSKLAKFGNVILMIANVWLSLVISMILISRDAFMEISNAFWSSTTPLMNSALLDFMLHKGFIFIPVFSVIFMLIKEFKIEGLRKRLLINLYLLLGSVAYMGVLTFLIYNPAFKATALFIG